MLVLYGTSKENGELILEGAVGTAQDDSSTLSGVKEVIKNSEAVTYTDSDGKFNLDYSLGIKESPKPLKISGEELIFGIN